MDYSNDEVVCMYPNPKTFEPGYNCPPIKVKLGQYFRKSAL
jgi:hypothetical protein